MDRDIDAVPTNSADQPVIAPHPTGQPVPHLPVVEYSNDDSPRPPSASSDSASTLTLAPTIAQIDDLIIRARQLLEGGSGSQDGTSVDVTSFQDKQRDYGVDRMAEDVDLEPASVPEERNTAARSSSEIQQSFQAESTSPRLKKVKSPPLGRTRKVDRRGVGTAAYGGRTISRTKRGESASLVRGVGADDVFKSSSMKVGEVKRRRVQRMALTGSDAGSDIVGSHVEGNDDQPAGSSPLHAEEDSPAPTASSSRLRRSRSNLESQPRTHESLSGTTRDASTLTRASTKSSRAGRPTCAASLPPEPGIHSSATTSNLPQRVPRQRPLLTSKSNPNLSSVTSSTTSTRGVVSTSGRHTRSKSHLASTQKEGEDQPDGPPEPVVRDPFDFDQALEEELFKVHVRKEAVIGGGGTAKRSSSRKGGGTRPGSSHVT
ncbi:hypothetical protein HDV00_003778 [Rhizophlyctis rosea]|nr:hypothetical protein HDV00_003778 [Rhizophlyctis rosea]